MRQSNVFSDIVLLSTQFGEAVKVLSLSCIINHLNYCCVSEKVRPFFHNSVDVPKACETSTVLHLHSGMAH